MSLILYPFSYLYTNTSKIMQQGFHVFQMTEIYLTKNPFLSGCLFNRQPIFMATSSYLLSLGGTPNSLVIHFSLLFQICACYQNQGDLMHFLELKSSAFQYSNTEYLSEFYLLLSQGYTLYIKGIAVLN